MKLYKIGVLGIGLFFVFLLFALFSQKSSVPGEETQALYQQMSVYQGRTLDEFAAKFGEPDDSYHPTLQGVVYAGWIYNTKDGRVRVMGAVRANRVEYLFAER